DAVAAGARLDPVGIGRALRHPEPAAVVEGEGDGLHHVRFAGEEGGPEALGQGHLFRRLVGRQRGVLGDDGAGEGQGGQGEKAAEHRGGYPGWWGAGGRAGIILARPASRSKRRLRTHFFRFILASGWRRYIPSQQDGREW